MRGRVLIVAGSDSGGGAGIQADIKTVTTLGGYATTAVTALTAQNTLGVQDTLIIPPAFIIRQMRSVLEDIGTDVVKLGMLPTAEGIIAVADFLAGYPDVPIVVDPVMIASSGDNLMAPSARDVLRRHLLPRATLLTPNIPEAESMLSQTIDDVDGMVEAGRALMAFGANAVLVKGGHMRGRRLTDVLITAHDIHFFESERIASCATHGTGCTLASAIATGMAQEISLNAAVSRARNFVHAAIRAAVPLGAGSAGPMNHGIMSADDWQKAQN